VRLAQRGHLLYQAIAASEVRQCQALGVLGRRTAGYQLLVAVVQMLRELVDDLALARG
jgi:hypothetical protein